jgi:hypothetical protein
MKKICIILSVFLAFSFKKVSAQIFTQGDVTVTLQPSGAHDINTCSTTGQMVYMVTVNNSFSGDSIIIRDMMGGAIVNTAVNTTGQTPWNTCIPVYNASDFISDNQVNGDFVNFGGTINKVISGGDTVYNIGNFYQIAVANPCQYANVSGQVYIDFNNDCFFNGSDVPLTSVGVQVSQTLNSPSMNNANFGSYSDINGNYSVDPLVTWQTETTVKIPSYYQFIFPSSSCSPVLYTFNSLPQTDIDFSLQCTSLIDVMCYAGSQGIVRPNIPFMLYPYVSNTGCDMASGLLKLVLDPDVVYNASLSTNTPTSVVGDTLIWNYTNLSSISNGGYWNSFMSGIHLTPIGAVNIGDTLCFRIFTGVLSGDIDSANNDYTICLPVVNSYDPNNKEVEPKGLGAKGLIPMNTTKLTYTIHFQNTGTAVAYNISIIDTLDSDIAIGSLRILGTSHRATPEWLSPGIVKFNFYNINLPDSNSNKPASNGFIRFSVDLNTSLSPGTEINNRANIYFDSNPAIVTNTVTNSLSNVDGVSEVSTANGLVAVYPNPTTGSFNVVFPLSTQKIEIFNSLGQNVLSRNFKNEANAGFELTGYGVYFIRVSTPEQIITKTIVVSDK